MDPLLERSETTPIPQQKTRCVHGALEHPDGPRFAQQAAYAEFRGPAYNGDMLMRWGTALLLLFAAPAIQANTSAQADSALEAINKVYWNAAGKHFYKSEQRAGRLDFWMSAHAWECILEAYQRTGNAAYKQQVTDIYDGFVKFFGSDWTQNDYNDDILWWVIACTRAYEVTGEKRYLDQARKHFDWVYSTQTDTVFGGGIWWRNDEHKTKNSCIVQPAIIAAMNLAKLTGNPAYRTQAESLYDWQKRTLTEASGKVYDAINFTGLAKGSTTYNQGTFIGSAQLLGKTADADKAMEWTRLNLADAAGILKNDTQSDFGTFAQIFIRYAVRFARTPTGAKHLAWLETNAQTAWKNRRKRDHITGFNWAVAAPDTGIQCQSAFGGVTMLNLLAMPEQTAIRLTARPSAASPGLRRTFAHGTTAWKLGARLIAVDGRPRTAPAPNSYLTGQRAEPRESLRID